MAQTLKHVVIIFLIIFLVLAGYVAYRALRLPNCDRALAEVKIAEFRALADGLRNRPPDDRLAMEALSKDAETAFPKKEKWKTEACPPYEDSDVEKLEELNSTLEEMNARIQSLLDENFSLQYDNDMTKDVLLVSGLRRIVRWNMTAAIQEGQQGDWQRCVDRILLMTDLSEKVLQAPSILFVMISLSMQAYIDRAIIYLLPQMPQDVMEKIRKRVENRPDRYAGFMEGWKLETDGVVRVFEENKFRQMREDPGEPSTFDLFKIAHAVGYLKRESRYYACLAIRTLDFLETRPDRHVSLDSAELIDKNEILFHALTYITLPNFRNLGLIASKDQDRKKAILTAMDLIQKQKKAGRPLSDIPPIFYDWKKDGEKQIDHQIVFEKNHGCIRKKADNPAEN